MRGLNLMSTARQACNMDAEQGLTVEKELKRGGAGSHERAGQKEGFGLGHDVSDNKKWENMNTSQKRKLKSCLE